MLTNNDELLFHDMLMTCFRHPEEREREREKRERREGSRERDFDVLLFHVFLFVNMI